MVYYIPTHLAIRVPANRPHPTPKSQTRAHVLSQGLAPIRYVDPSQPARGPTEGYPHNPNGSPHGIAALCSPCGRHLAIMPHPERSWLAWQVRAPPPHRLIRGRLIDFSYV